MKKTIALCLALAGTVSLCGCLDEQSQDFTISQYDSESRIEINFEDLSTPDKDENSDTDDNSKNTEDTESQNSNSSPDVPNTGTLLVKDKKYTFEGKDLVIIDVLNESNQNLSVTINGKYLDENGNVLKNETQTFDQFSAGYNKYFLLRPEISFSEFTYSVHTEISSGPFYAKDLSFSFNGLLEGKMSITEQELKGDYKLYPTLVAEYEFKLDGALQLVPKGTFILFNDDDEIVLIGQIGGLLDPNEKNFKCTIIYQTTEEKLNRPPEFQGEFRAIYVLEEIAPYER